MCCTRWQIREFDNELDGEPEWCTETTPTKIAAAFHIEDESRIGFWDAPIVASAASAGPSEYSRRSQRPVNCGHSCRKSVCPSSISAKRSGTKSSRLLFATLATLLVSFSSFALPLLWAIRLPRAWPRPKDARTGPEGSPTGLHRTDFPPASELSRPGRLRS